MSYMLDMYVISEITKKPPLSGFTDTVTAIMQAMQQGGAGSGYGSCI